MIKGIGVDIVEHERIKIDLNRKILTDNEREVFRFLNPLNQTEYLASRFAAKEAIIKATNKKYLLNEIEILNDQDGQPYSNIPGIKISLSHEQKYSIAFAIWEV